MRILIIIVTIKLYCFFGGFISGMINPYRKLITPSKARNYLPEATWPLWIGPVLLWTSGEWVARKLRGVK